MAYLQAMLPTIRSRSARLSGLLVVVSGLATASLGLRMVMDHFFL